MFEEYKSYLSKIKLSNKRILSVGCGNAVFEKYLLKTAGVHSIDCIDKKPVIKSTIDADFIQYKFNKKYDIIFFIHSLHFIIGESYSSMDKNYFMFMKNKISTLLRKNGYIFVKLVKKEWFIKNKPVPKSFLKSLNNSYENILKMRFNVIDITDTEYDIYMLLQL